MAWSARKQLAMNVEPLLGLSRPAGGWGRPGRPSGATTAVDLEVRRLGQREAPARADRRCQRPQPRQDGFRRVPMCQGRPGGPHRLPRHHLRQQQDRQGPHRVPRHQLRQQQDRQGRRRCPRCQQVRLGSFSIRRRRKQQQQQGSILLPRLLLLLLLLQPRRCQQVALHPRHHPRHRRRQPRRRRREQGRPQPPQPRLHATCHLDCRLRLRRLRRQQNHTRRCYLHHLRRQLLAPTTTSYDDLQLPLVLDPWRPNSEAMLLKAPQHPWDSAVWLTIGRNDEELLVVKQTPYHTLLRASLARRVLYSRGNSKAADFTYEDGARKELVQLPGIFVQPLLVRDREYSREAEGDETCPDREVLTVIPYYPCGDAGKYLAHVATPLMAALTEGKRSVAAVVEELVGIVTRLSRAMFELVSQVHKKGFVLIDHKLENMVYDHVHSRWQLIDAEEVRHCSKFSGKNRHTPAYAAPEQTLKKDMWVEPRSDVFACGRCIERAINDCRGRLKATLGEGSQALADATKAFDEALEPLLKVVKKCTLPTPAMRPVAADALHRLREQ